MSRAVDVAPHRAVNPPTDVRVPAAIGREARLELRFERRAGRTVVAHAYAEPPFRIGPALSVADAAYVIVVCSGPGVFAGDTLTQSVHVAAGARVVLTSQAALQLHPGAPGAPGSPGNIDRPAVIRHRYDVVDDGELQCEWDPIIPFAGARALQRYDVSLAPAARLLWSDAVMAGRVSRGETWRFASLDHELRIAVGGALQYLERYRIGPGDRPPSRRWIAGAANYFGSTVAYHSDATADTAERLQRTLDAIDGVTCGVDTIEPSLLLARFASASGVPFAAARAACRAETLRDVFKCPPLAWRK